MGRDKRDLQLGGTTFFERVIAATTPVFERVIAVGPVPPDYEGAVISDEADAPNAALSGIRAALAHAGGERIWIMATDYPLIRSAVLAYLRRRFESAGEPLCVPHVHGHPQMLCAGYDPRLLPLLDANAGEGDLRLTRLLEQCHPLLVDESELAPTGSMSVFMNVNTPAEYDRAVEIYEETTAG